MFCNSVPLTVNSRINFTQCSHSRTRKFDHITPVLKQLHWLPVCYRIIFKILLLVYKALNAQH